MKYFEKAIENYAKEMKEFYDLRLKQDILNFNRLIEQMTADGKCPGVECRFCPVRLASEHEPSLNTPCGIETPQRRREIIAMEVRDERY